MGRSSFCAVVELGVEVELGCKTDDVEGSGKCLVRQLKEASWKVWKFSNCFMMLKEKTALLGRLARLPSINIFIGSSSAAKSQAKEFVRTFTNDVVSFTPWWEAFTAGRSLLEGLDEVRKKVQGAVLLFSPEMITEVRKREQNVPNLNVLFEMGYFYSYFSKERVAMIKYGDFYLPSDLDGYLWIFGSKGFRRARKQVIGKRTKSEFKRWINAF